MFWMMFAVCLSVFSFLGTDVVAISSVFASSLKVCQNLQGILRRRPFWFSKMHKNETCFQKAKQKRKKKHTHTHTHTQKNDETTQKWQKHKNIVKNNEKTCKRSKTSQKTNEITIFVFEKMLSTKHSNLSRREGRPARPVFWSKHHVFIVFSPSPKKTSKCCNTTIPLRSAWSQTNHGNSIQRPPEVASKTKSPVKKEAWWTIFPGQIDRH